VLVYDQTLPPSQTFDSKARKGAFPLSGASEGAPLARGGLQILD